MTDPRYPIGPFEPSPRPAGDAERRARIAVIERHPERVRRIVEGLDDTRLDRPYRAGGWTLRQLTHHLADSHLNAYMRFRLALTEENPTIRPYDQNRWAELSDSRTSPVASSLRILEGLHARWAALLAALTPEEFGRGLRHPEIGEISLDFMLDLYAWHCAHHEAHLEAGAARSG